MMGPKRSVSQFASKSSILSQSGQGTLEYILLLVVTIGIVSLLAAKYFKPIGDFASNYFGDYTQCLLETGELPSLGAEGAEGQCNSEFEPFTIGAGRPSNGGGGGGGSGSGNAGNGSGSESGSGSQNGNGNGENGDGDGSGEGDGDLAGSSGGGGGRGRRGTPAISESNSSFGSGSSRDDGGGGDEKIAANESLLADGNKGNSDSGYGGGSSRRDNYKGIAGRIPIEQEKKEKQAPSKVVASKKDSEQGKSSDPGKIMAPERDPAQNKISEEEPMGFGKWLRILFIVLIIMAILVFFGLQAVQISKGWE